MKLGRRDFLKGLGATAAALMLPRGLAGKSEAERLVTPERGGLLVPAEQRVALIDEFELSRPMWQGGIFVSDELRADGTPAIGRWISEAGRHPNRGQVFVSDELRTDFGKSMAHWYVNGENPAARDLPGYGLHPDAPMATIAYALRASGDRPATITLWALPGLRVRKVEGEPSINPAWEWFADRELPCHFTSSAEVFRYPNTPRSVRNGRSPFVKL